jgi:hypothetical protein
MALPCKRLLEPYADLLEAPPKYRRYDAHVASPEDRLDGSHELIDARTFEERPRGSFSRTSCRPTSGGAPDGVVSGAAEASGRKIDARAWAEAVILGVAGSPSLDDAVLRCETVLLDFEAEVQKVATMEVDAAVAAAPESLQTMQHTKRVLMMAVRHLAQRCRRSEASAREADDLREALGRAQVEQRRLARANDLLQEHLRLHLDGRY